MQQRIPFLELASCLTMILLGAVVVADEPKSEPAPSDAKANDAPKARVTISKETTRIDGPLTEDGYIDYVAALNEHCSKDVTVENNAAVLLWQAIGPKYVRAEDREQFFKMIGIDPLPEEGDYLVGINEIAERAAQRSDPPREVREVLNELIEQQSPAMGRPWRMGDHPLIKEWLDANEKPLARVVEATKRPRCYSPMISGSSPAVVSILLPYAQESREMARLLSARAMLHLGSGKVEETWQDSLAMHRLARLVGQGPTLVEMLVGMAIDGIACSVDVRLAQSGKLSADQANRFRQDLEKLPPLPSVADKIDVGERYMYLDVAQSLAQHGTGVLDDLVGGGGDDATTNLVTSILAKSIVDWDVVMREGNSLYDEMADAARKPTYQERYDATTDIFQEIKHRTEVAKHPLSYAKAMLKGKSPRTVAGEQMGLVLTALLVPAVEACLSAQHRIEVTTDLTRIALALAAYHDKHGEYPRTLDPLTPEYIDPFPPDPFTGEKLKYSRQADGYLLYSVGPNQQDNNGHGPVHELGDDIAIRTPEEAE